MLLFLLNLQECLPLGNEYNTKGLCGYRKKKSKMKCFHFPNYIWYKRDTVVYSIGQYNHVHSYTVFKTNRRWSCGINYCMYVVHGSSCSHQMYLTHNNSVDFVSSMRVTSGYWGHYGTKQQIITSLCHRDTNSVIVLPTTYIQIHTYTYYMLNYHVLLHVAFILFSTRAAYKMRAKGEGSRVGSAWGDSTVRIAPAHLFCPT